MAVGRKRGSVRRLSGKKRKSGKKSLFQIDSRRLFFLAGTVAVLCILLLFINALYGEKGASDHIFDSVFAGEPQSFSSAVGESAAGLVSDGTGLSGIPPAVPVSAVSSYSDSDAADGTGVNAAASGMPGVSLSGGAPIQIQPRDVTPSFSVPKARGTAKLSFVIDDAGQNVETLQRYLVVPMPLAVAVLPKLALTKRSAALVRAAGKELMLHQPMQAENLDLWAGPGAITPGMGLGEIKALIAENLAELGEGVRGLNNHEGSLITEDEVRIGAVLDAARENGIFFMDSRTSSRTKAPEAARIRRMQILERDIFIDNVLERDAMLTQIYEGLELANLYGKAIMIGHVDKSADILPALLTELAPVLKAQGYQIVCPSQLVDR